jgi:hypothetical protein
MQSVNKRNRRQNPLFDVKSLNGEMESCWRFSTETNWKDDEKHLTLIRGTGGMRIGSRFSPELSEPDRETVRMWGWAARKALGIFIPDSQSNSRCSSASLLEVTRLRCRLNWD